MNREKIITYVSSVLKGFHKDSTHNHYSDVVVAVNKICDDFENTKKTCEWKLDDADNNVYKTGCGNYFQLSEDTPTDNEFKFCCYCGEKLKDTQ